MADLRIGIYAHRLHVRLRRRDDPEINAVQHAPETGDGKQKTNVHIYTHRVNYIFLPPTVQSINLQIFIYFSSTGAAGKSVAGTLEPIASRLDREASAVGDKRERAVRFDGYFPDGGDNRADDVAETVVLHSGAAFDVFRKITLELPFERIRLFDADYIFDEKRNRSERRPAARLDPKRIYISFKAVSSF